MELMRMQAEGCHGTQLGVMFDQFFLGGWMCIFLGGGEEMEATTRVFFENGRTKCKHPNELKGDLDYPFWGDQAMQRMHGRIR